jgi:hypothetical protein
MIKASYRDLDTDVDRGLGPQDDSVQHLFACGVFCCLLTSVDAGDDLACDLTQLPN